MRTSSSAVSATSRRFLRSDSAADPTEVLASWAGESPKTSGTSPAPVTGVAPSRRSAFVPPERALVLSPLVCRRAVRADPAGLDTHNSSGERSRTGTLASDREPVKGVERGDYRHAQDG